MVSGSILLLLELLLPLLLLTPPPPYQPQRQGAISKVKEVYLNIPPATRVHLTLVLIVTVLSLGLIDPTLLVLDLGRTVRGLQIWRPFTAAAFLGTPSMSWLTSTYFMVQYGELVGGGLKGVEEVVGGSR